MRHLDKNTFARVQKGTVAKLCIVCMLFVWSCQSKNETEQPSDEHIYVEVENASEYSNIVEVKLMGSDKNINRSVELARGNWKNGGFIIVLPQTLDSNYLFPLIRGDWWWAGEFDFYNGAPLTVIDALPTISISNENVKVSDACFVGVDKDGFIVANFLRAKINTIEMDNNTVAILTYVDSDVTISGYDTRKTDFPDGYSIEINKTYSIKWEKGWNVWYRSIYTTITDNTNMVTEQWTTTPVNELKWYGNSSFRL